MFVTGSLTVFFDVAYQSILPALVERDQLVDGNAQARGQPVERADWPVPAVGGLLVQGSAPRRR